MEMTEAELLMVEEMAGLVKRHPSSATAICMHPQGDLLGHGATGHEDCRRLAQEARDILLELADHTTLTVAVGGARRRQVRQQLTRLP
jgi:hypothetical protein